MDIFNKSAEIFQDAASSVVHEIASTRIEEGTFSLPLIEQALAESGHLTPVIDINSNRKSPEHEPKPEAAQSNAAILDFTPPVNMEPQPQIPTEQIKTAPIVKDEPISNDELHDARERQAKARQTIENIYPRDNSEALDDAFVDGVIDDIYGDAA